MFKDYSVLYGVPPYKQLIKVNFNYNPHTGSILIGGPWLTAVLKNIKLKMDNKFQKDNEMVVVIDNLPGTFDRFNEVCEFIGIRLLAVFPCGSNKDDLGFSNMGCKIVVTPTQSFHLGCMLTSRGIISKMM